MSNISDIRVHVEDYFRNHLPKYTVLDIRKKSYHPKDDYLYMVSAKKEGNDTEYAVWTSWNEETQSLNYGHYNLKSIEDCERVFEEYYYKG